MRHIAVILLAGCALLSACDKKDAAPPPAQAVAVAPAAPAAAVAPPAPTPAVVATPAGFDPAVAPQGQAPTGAWPYFGLMDGYEPTNKTNSIGKTALEKVADHTFDRYEFFDGTKLIPVEGRLFTQRGIGKGASFFQVQKTYEKLVHDLGGVTVWEGSGQVMETAKLDFADPRHRGTFRRHDTMGVYMVRTPTSEIWVEVYQPWDTPADNYWYTVVEKKALEVKVKMLPAEEMKKALDSTGHVALYINFDTDKATIKPDSQPIIEQVVKLLNASPDLKLEVQGHTDNAGTAPHNQTLSEGRANAVVGSLMAQGVTLARLQPKGYGQTKPLADNGTEDGRAKNRRVELVKR